MSQHVEYPNGTHSLQLNINLAKDDAYEKEELGVVQDAPNAVPTVCGMPLKYVS